MNSFVDFVETLQKFAEDLLLHFLFKARDNFGSPLISEGFIVFSTQQLKQEQDASAGGRRKGHQ